MWPEKGPIILPVGQYDIVIIVEKMTTQHYYFTD